MKKTTSTVLGITEYQYNRFGDSILETHENALQSDVDSSGAFTSSDTNLKNLETKTGFNGFGQRTFQQMGEPGRIASLHTWTYHPNGELETSSEGNAQNLTKYTYYTDPTNLGRIASITKGIGNPSGTAVVTPHETTTLEYDAFGRVQTRKLDGFSYTTQYDTADRVVSQTLPNNQLEVTTYHASGAPEIQCRYAGVSTPDNKPDNSNTDQCLRHTLDSLGRVVNTRDETAEDGSFDRYYTYDPFDRPIKITNDALTMVTSGDARAMFIAYDTEGRTIKVLSPELSGSGGGYNDNRRPYTEFEYDHFGRKIAERRLRHSVSPIAPTNMALPTGVSAINAIATTSFTYDPLDRMTSSFDNIEGTQTLYAFDAAGNVTQKKQLVCKTDDAQCMQHFNDEDGQTDGYATSTYAYDATGRLTRTTDARKQTSRVKYNTLGLPTQQIDARDITVKTLTYTPDGLPLEVREPGFGNTTEVTTKSFVYDSRRYPTKQRTHGINNASIAETKLEYDFAGRVVKMDLPEQGVIEQTYDSRGNLTGLRDADGFKTEYRFDARGRLRLESKLRRGADLDSAIPNNLTNRYEYDFAGNLTQKIERGLVTKYKYNSLGKAQTESRPSYDGSSAQQRIYTYDIEGERRTATSYDYTGPLLNANPQDRNFVSVADTGSLERYTPSLFIGNREITTELFGHGDNNAGKRERFKRETFNGLGSRFKQEFRGDPGIYAPYRTANGSFLGDRQAYATMRRFDGNGNLLKQYKRALNTDLSFADTVNPLTVTATDPQGSSDLFEYIYTPTNKQAFRSSQVNVYTSSQRGDGEILIGRTTAALEITPIKLRVQPDRRAW
ncbi:MAG: RHS repeat protein [Pleurocapsa sp. SU_196_0]|nr:RHS repeat protein [Pleurocapsa sp. SU_196_0]